MSLAIEIALRHYADHLPFHRIAGIFERDGLRIDRATLSRVGGRVADAHARIVDCMEAELLDGDDVLGIDGTGIKILASPRCERRTIYVIHGRGNVVFRALDRADAEHVLAGFEGFCGVTVADAATVHTGSFVAALRVFVALCNTHALRKFHEGPFVQTLDATRTGTRWVTHRKVLNSRKFLDKIRSIFHIRRLAPPKFRIRGFLER